jgi:two-component system, cell cycle response regulator CtrA
VRVLIVEGDSSVAQSLELMLKSEVLLDLNLPDMSGYDVLRSLRLGKVKTPVLILSGYAGIEDKVRALGVGADDYLTKPFHKDELIARIHAIVRRSMGHAEPTVKSAT